MRPRTIGRSRNSLGFSASPFVFSAFPPRSLAAGWSVSVRARRWPPRYLLRWRFYHCRIRRLVDQLWIIYLGYGVLGGCGLGLGYIAPVSTLVKWFPDRPGMATGMAIMGFGGGAFIGSNLSLVLMDHFQSATSPGVAQTFIALGLIYFSYIMFGSFIVRVPAKDWKPAGYQAPDHPHGLITSANVAVNQAWRTPQFWLLWIVLCFNVTAGIGILEQASPMIQEMFPGKITVAAATGFVALLSLFNMGGRFVWSSLSDYTGRKAIYVIYLLLGAVLYALIPLSGHSGALLSSLHYAR